MSNNTIKMFLNLNRQKTGHIQVVKEILFIHYPYIVEFVLDKVHLPQTAGSKLNIAEQRVLA